MKKRLYWQINENIRAPKLRVIGGDGKQLGILTKEEAIDRARQKGLTLVEIAPKAKPPVVKIVDFGKFRYQEEKKLRTQAKKTKVSELKEVRFSPFIAENDYNTRLEKVKEFLAEKNKVKITVVFKGRQMGSKQFGYNLVKRIVDSLGKNIAIDMNPKFLGRYLTTIVSPVNKPISKKEKKEKKETKKKKEEKKDAKTKNKKVTDKKI